ncbi:Hypothetical predicted protein [Pelobates cultripes]|uniref:Uncharacterized protein n=1 Tax=Pelobates cultripes TaxID=61616 RepID=A0AAD1R2I3_PELCU|nr:Hypothetical predicted protein [Pelobates cultripes]
MADIKPDAPRGSTSASNKDDLELEELQPHPHSGKEVPQRKSDLQWATETYIALMVMEIKAYMASEMAVLKTGVSSADCKCGTVGGYSKTMLENPGDPRSCGCWRASTVHHEATFPYLNA